MTIYLVRAGEDGPVKVGFTRNVRGRLSKIQSDCPARIVLIGLLEGDVKRERELHTRFSHCLIGGEWFRPDPEILALANLNPPPAPAEPTPSNVFAKIRLRVFNMTQAEFATALKRNQSTTCRWERDEFPPRLTDIVEIRNLALARGLEWSDALLFGEAA